LFLSKLEPGEREAAVLESVMKRLLVLLSICLTVYFSVGVIPIAHAAGSGVEKSAPTRVNASSPEGTYVIGTGDVLDISVWREPMLTGQVLVRNDGMISVALLGDVQAAGRTPMALRDEIQQRLKEYVENPAVTVTVHTPVSQKYYVIGEVRTPSEYDLVKDLTVVQAIARAGGFTEWADKSSIILLRNQNGVEKRIKINYKDIVKGKGGGENQKVEANDTIVVP
jgi:polysaccharide export outer membrane protein